MHGTAILNTAILMLTTGQSPRSHFMSRAGNGSSEAPLSIAQGNGQVVLRVTPVPRATPLPACDLTERGVVEELWVESFVAGRAPATAGRAMAGAACAALGERGPREMGLREGVRGRQRGVVELGGGEAFGNGSGVMAWARTSTEMLMGAARPGEVGKVREGEGGREAALPTAEST